MVLLGTEVKSLRDGKASLADAYATVDDGEVWLRNLHIPEYHHGSWTNHEPRRNRKLLLHRHQIDVLIGKIKDGNLALVPLSLYFFEGKVKVELALARGKQAHDKRQDMARARRAARSDSRIGQASQGHELIGAAYAQLSAVSYGVSDFVGGVASRRAAALRIMLVTYPLATVLLGVLAVTAGGPIHPGAVLWGSLYGVSQAIGVYWFYAAVSAGPISVVSPLAAVLNAAVPVAVGVALGERPGETASVGVVLAMFAVILVSRESPADEDVRTHRFTSKVAWLTVGSGVAFGLDFVLLHQAPVVCRMWPLFFARAAATVLVFAVAAVSKNLRASVQHAAAAGGRRGAARYLRQRQHAAGDPEMDAVAGQHPDLAVPGDDGHPGDHRAARAGDSLAGDRHGVGGGIGEHDRR